MVPPVAVQVTVTLDVVLSLMRPMAVKTVTPPAWTLAVAGVTSMATRVGTGFGPPLSSPEHPAITAHTTASADRGLTADGKFLGRIGLP